MEKKKIINGPDKKKLMAAFSGYRTVTLRLKDRRDQQFIIDSLKHEDGSGNSFIFQTVTGISGCYNTRKREGYINTPSAH